MMNFNLLVLPLMSLICATFLYRKTAFAYKISWIHLHFAVVLLLALIVFLAGIETATDNKVSNDIPVIT